MPGCRNRERGEAGEVDGESIAQNISWGPGSRAQVAAEAWERRARADVPRATPAASFRTTNHDISMDHYTYLRNKNDPNLSHRATTPCTTARAPAAAARTAAC